MLESELGSSRMHRWPRLLQEAGTWDCCSLGGELRRYLWEGQVEGQVCPHNDERLTDLTVQGSSEPWGQHGHAWQSTEI
jgi:hypothetical protein